MANMPALNKDGALTGTLIVDSDTSYSSSIDLKNSESALKKIRIVMKVVDLDTGDPLDFVLMGDDDSTIDVSSTSYYKVEQVEEDGIILLPLPKDFNHRYVGVSCFSAGDSEAIIEEFFLDV